MSTHFSHATILVALLVLLFFISAAITGAGRPRPRAGVMDVSGRGDGSNSSRARLGVTGIHDRASVSDGKSGSQA